MTGPSRCYLPVVTLIAQVNMNLRGWGAYFSRGYPAKAFRQINSFAVRQPGTYSVAASVPFIHRKGSAGTSSCTALGWCRCAQFCRDSDAEEQASGEPDTGNPFVRFDEGGLRRNRAAQSSTRLNLFVFRRHAIALCRGAVLVCRRAFRSDFLWLTHHALAGDADLIRGAAGVADGVVK